MGHEIRPASEKEAREHYSEKRLISDAEWSEYVETMKAAY
jgi:hypothetical protein